MLYIKCVFFQSIVPSNSTAQPQSSPGPDKVREEHVSIPCQHFTNTNYNLPQVAPIQSLMPSWDDRIVSLLYWMNTTWNIQSNILLNELEQLWNTPLHIMLCVIFISKYLYSPLFVVAWDFNSIICCPFLASSPPLFLLFLEKIKGKRLSRYQLEFSNIPNPWYWKYLTIPMKI